MDCPSHLVLASFIGETLDRNEHDAVNLHISECSKCEKSLEQLAADPDTEIWVERRKQRKQKTQYDSGDIRALVDMCWARYCKDLTCDYKPAPIRTHTPVFSPGSVIGHFRIKGHLGKGGFGDVYRAHNTQTDEIVALKIPRFFDPADKRRIKRFLDEGRSLKKLEHPGIIKVHNFGQFPSGMPFIEMEFVSGLSFAEEIDQPWFTPQRGIKVLLKVVEAVAYAHQNSFYHRDLKPANILLRPNGQPVIIDFGLAIHTSNLDMIAGEVCGTIDYMSPGQLDGLPDSMDGREEVWALGVMLYQILAGKKPFVSTDKDRLANLVRNARPLPIREFNSDASPAFEPVVKKALHKKFAERYTTVTDFGSALANALEISTQETLPFRKRISSLFVDPTDAPSMRETIITRLRGDFRVAMTLCLMVVVIVVCGAFTYRTYANQTLKESEQRERETVLTEIRICLDQIKDAPLDRMAEAMRKFDLFDRVLADSVLKEFVPANDSEELKRLLILQPRTARADSSGRVSELLLKMKPSEFPKYWRTFLGRSSPQQRARVASVFMNELKRQGPADWGPHLPPAQPTLACIRRIEDAAGFIHNDFALCQKLLFSEFSKTCTDMKNAGFTPALAQRWQQSGNEYVAAIWNRSEFPNTVAKKILQQQDHSIQSIIQFNTTDLQGELTGETSPKFVNSFPGLARIELSRASQRLPLAKRIESQRELAQQALKVDSTNFSAKTVLGRALFFEGKYEAACEILSDVVKNVGKLRAQSSARTYRAFAYAKLGQIDDANSDLNCIHEFLEEETNLSADIIRGFMKCNRAMVRLYSDPWQADCLADVDAMIQKHPHSHDAMFFAAGAYAVAKQVYTELAEAETASNRQAEKLNRLANENANKAIELLKSAYATGKISALKIHQSIDFEPIRHLPGYQQLFTDQTMPEYKISWNQNANFVAKETLGLSIQENLEKCRQLALRGLYPVSLSVMSTSETQTTTATVWHETPWNPVSKRTVEKRALALAALICLDAKARTSQTPFEEPDLLWDLLDYSSRPTLRTACISNLHRLDVPLNYLLARLLETSSPGCQQAILLALGEYDAHRDLAAHAFENAADQIRGLAILQPDSGVHYAANWLLDRWAISRPDIPVQEQASNDKNWYIDPNKIEMVVIQPCQFPFGPAFSDKYRMRIETQRVKQIDYRFAVSAKEITCEQIGSTYNDGNFPARVNWFNAVKFCNELDRRAGIPEDERYYRPIKKDDYSKGVVVVPASRNLKGHRLPTSAEYEAFSRAGTVTRWPCGDDENELVNYAWFGAKTDPQAVGLLRPNSWGLSDSQGNVAELCHETFSLRDKDPVDREETVFHQERTLRGGGCGYHASGIRSATRKSTTPKYTKLIGFRIVRRVD